MTLKVDQGHWERQHSRVQIIFCSKHVSISHRFLSYSTSNNGVPLKSGFGIIRGHWKRHHSSSMIHCYGFNVPVKGSIDEGYGGLRNWPSWTAYSQSARRAVCWHGRNLQQRVACLWTPRVSPRHKQKFHGRKFFSRRRQHTRHCGRMAAAAAAFHATD